MSETKWKRRQDGTFDAMVPLNMSGAGSAAYAEGHERTFGERKDARFCGQCGLRPHFCECPPPADASRP
jgi:hypothetical protein